MSHRQDVEGTECLFEQLSLDGVSLERIVNASGRFQRVEYTPQMVVEVADHSVVDRLHLLPVFKEETGLCQTIDAWCRDDTISVASERVRPKLVAAD